ncbi:hypothetical protein LAV84_05010 [Rhizobium sp. VS19-DR104.2]|uniref:hypothetical protein n=1 Tax=unclassified Rhizobium TaxID=2613769 RepID=UPI001CC40F4C|nr:MULTISPECIES: hypothetical protein [unclassified Rhizobium]MBZ5757957.1 hypothetical protein [Rhizobium sp. VS19-DR96]MBZ5765213.1 hypothetical protein [Rhizobium sp. VS19-DR129.2]MBZ5772756.1 hypothetical protein [Rhizobium sp. VS19-DRK62.2]MBZ5782557.1 hypothetical protein [Rhizobium sp. VS19-DR121]MBZ5800005.1 hypothetical protein [Rhizobium sp. VS19-DR181]
MTIQILLTAIFSAFACILFPGWGMKQILQRNGVKFRTESISGLLSAFSLGVIINAIVYIAIWTIGSSDRPFRLAVVVVGINLLIGILGVWFSGLPKFRIDRRLTVLLLVGSAIGIFAAFRFPSTLDSVQIFQIQTFMLKTDGGQLVDGGPFLAIWKLLFGGLGVPMQSGFAGLTLVPSLLGWSLPVTTVAAGNKVLLFALAAIVSLYSARQFGLRPTLLAALLVFVNFALSQFGLYGLFATGKDSIFSILMGIASVAALIGDDEKSNESGLFMCAAILLGAVTVPFLLLFWALYFVFSGGAILNRAIRQAAWCICPLVISVVGVHAAFATPGTHPLGLLPAVVAGFVFVAVLAWVSKLIDGRMVPVSPSLLSAASVFPAVCLIGISLMMPVTGHIIMGYKDGAPITVSHAPLDGTTTAIGFLLGQYPTNNPWLSVLLIIVLALAPMLSPRLRTPFNLALFSFLPLAAAFAIVNVKLGIHILPDFNLWDITRDTVQWFVGAFGALLVMIGLAAVLPGNRSAIAATAIASLVFIGGTFQNYQHHLWLLTQSPTITSSGGFDEPVSAFGMDYTWRKGRNLPLYVSSGSDFDPNFYSYQMFGAKSVAYFEPGVVGREKEQVFFVGASDAVAILSAAQKAKSSGSAQPVGKNAFVLKVSNDGKSAFDYSSLPEVVVEPTGTFNTEASGGTSFAWASQDASLRVTKISQPGSKYCPTVKIVNAWADPDLTVRLSSNLESQILPVAKDTSFDRPAEQKICVQLDDNGSGIINLKSNHPAKQFPNDTRTVAFGLVWPVK